MTSTSIHSTRIDAPVVRGLTQASPRWFLYYYVVQIVCQLALLSDALAPARVIFRSATFGMSLLALAITTGRASSRAHPALPYALFVFLILLAESVHPETTSALGAFATLAIYVAILGPLFWVRRLRLDAGSFRQILIVVWAFQSLSALVGALQVFYPSTFQPAVATILSDSYVSSLKITLSNGTEILRPSGLTDTPGGGAAGAAYAILLGMGLWTSRPRIMFRVLLLASFAVGMFVLYICQIRSLVVMVGIATFVTASVHAARGRVRESIYVSAIIGGLGIGAFLAAVATGGNDVMNRFSTLTSESPTEVYYTNRGIFLEQTWTTLLPKYPFGAGLGRWGMFSSYFENAKASLIYVEIQWTGWLLDGGVALVAVYSVMLVVTLHKAWTLAKTSNANWEIGSWGAMLVGYDIGTVALTFNFPVFISSSGLDFWLLNAAFFAVASDSPAEPLRGPHVHPSTNSGVTGR